MRKNRIISSFFVAVIPIALHSAEFVDVPSDPTAVYAITVKDVGKGDDALLIISKRDGTSGTSYALREVNCVNQTFRYMGEGDTLEDALNNVHDKDKMSGLVAGSISFHIVQAACK